MKTFKWRKEIVLLSIFILFLFSGCGITRVYTPQEEKEALKRVYDLLQSKKLIEDFPFLNPFEIDAPNVQEKAGVILKPFQGEKITVKGKYRRMMSLASVDAFLYGAFEKPTTTDQRGSSSYTLTHSMNSPGSYDLRYIRDSVETIIEGPKYGLGQIVSKGELKSKIKFGKTFELDETEFRLKETFEGAISFLTKGWAFSEENNVLLKDIDTDGIVGIRDITSLTLIFPLLPDNRVKPGDKWEKQVYTWFKPDGVMVPKYAIELYTFEVAGFSNVAGRRCAIIEYVMEEYEMGAGGVAGVKTTDDVKRKAKTLTKMSVGEVAALTSQVRRTGIVSVVTQSVEKHYGIFAFNYSNGVIVELHNGRQYHQAYGVKSDFGDSATRNINRAQFVYKADVIEEGVK